LQPISVLYPKKYENLQEAWLDIYRFVFAKSHCDTCDDRISESLYLSELSTFKLYKLAGLLELNPKNTLGSKTARAIGALIETEKILLRTAMNPFYF